MKRSTEYHRDRAQRDFTKIRRLAAQATALLHLANVIKDGLGQHLLHLENLTLHGAQVFESFVELAAFDDVMNRLTAIEEQLLDHERALQCSAEVVLMSNTRATGSDSLN